MRYQDTNTSHTINFRTKARPAQYKPVEPPDVKRLFTIACTLFALAVPSAQTGSRGDVLPPFERRDASARSLDGGDSYRASLTNVLHWGHFPLKVAFARRMTSGSQDLDQLAQNGFEQWTKATGGVVRFEFIGNREDADVVVTYDVLPARPGNGERLGQTGFSYNRSRLLLARATMRLNVWENMTRGDLLRFQNTAAHEFGHALGINGHSPDPDDLMYYSSSSSRGVTVRDVNTLSTAYGVFARRAEKYRYTEPNDRNEKQATRPTTGVGRTSS